MALHKTARSALFISLALIVVGAIAWVALHGVRYWANMGTTVDYAQLAASIAVAALVSFAFGALRYSLAAGLTLLTAVVHDQLVTLALSVLASLVLPQAYTLPVVVLACLAFTYCQTLPMLRAARDLGRGTVARDRTYDTVANDAATLRFRPVVVAAIGALLLVAAAILGGSVRLAGMLAPLVIGLAVSFYSALRISPYVWAAAAGLRRNVKARK